MYQRNLWEGVQAKDMTKKRITISIDEEMLMNVKQIQSKLVDKTKKNWNFSKTLSLILAIGLGGKDFDDILDLVIGYRKKEKKK